MLRKLKESDIKYMFEWMRDDSVVQFLDTDFSAKSLEDCREFIKNSITDKNMHFAIVDSDDEYMGTVSLKNIDYDNKIAEMAITIRRCAMGKGHSYNAIKEVFEYGRKKLNLKKFYWYVNPLNARALKFYDKNGFLRINKLEEIGELDNKYIWYISN